MEYILFILGFVLLGIGGDLLIKGSIDLSLRYKIPKIIIGMTIIALLTSFPEIIVCIKASLKNHHDITIGNIIGSNIANLSLVVGITSLFYKINITKTTTKFITPFMILITTIFSCLLIFSKEITYIIGLIFIITLIIFNILLIKKTKKENTIQDFQSSFLKIIILLISGGACLHFGANFALEHGVIIAKNIGISEKVIGITLFALGTSLPEVFACITAAKRQEISLVVGNILGSNIFNILAAIGLTSVITDINIEADFNSDVIFMLTISIIFYIFLKIGKEKNIISKKEGVLLLTLYILYISKMII
tara:strand:+ start:1189 stop:2109 length:921 start_codon:yes stop_codon:yes gene_type:complete